MMNARKRFRDFLFLLVSHGVIVGTAVYIFLALNVDLAVDLQWHDGQRLGQLALLVFVVFALLLPGVARGLLQLWAFLPCWIRAGLGFVFVLGFISSVMAPLSRWALLEWGISWMLIILTLIIAVQRHKLQDCLDQWLVMFFFATAAAYTLSSFVVYLAMLEIGPFFNVRELYVSFSNVRFFGHIQTMMLPFLLLPAMWWGVTRTRCFMLSVIPVAWWMLVVASGTRGTWVALTAGVVAVAIFGGASGRQWIKWQVGGLVAGLLFYVIFIWAVPQLLEQPAWFIHRSDDIVSLSHRELLWTNSIQFVLQHPWFGIGPMHYAYYISAVAAHPHSALLQWLAEWGIPAAVMLTSTFAYSGLIFACYVRQLSKIESSNRMLLKIALLAALTGAAAQAMVDGVLVMPVSQTLLVLLCGWAIGMYSGKYGSKLSRRNRQGPVVIGVTLVASSLIVWGVMPEIYRLAELEQAYLVAHPPHDPSLPRLFPRFWAQGWIGTQSP